MTRCNLNPSAFAAIIFLSLLCKSSSYLRTLSAGQQPKSSCITALNREFVGSLQTTYRLEIHGNSLARLPFSIRSRSQRSFSLSVGNWWEDDLPNILGINPFEAALLFGALYKFYGPGVLYEFAREAGKLFSTYAPIVRDLSLDIFNEGKDYLEEDRDRELMRKGGVDIENMPRKTTNIIERFQAGMEAQELAANGSLDDDTVSTVEKSIAAVSAARNSDRLAAASKSKNKSKQLAMAGGGDLEGAGGGEEFALDSMEGGRMRRKSKRQVLEAKDVDIEKVIQGSKDKLNLEENALAKNLNEMQQRFTDFQVAAEARASGTGTGVTSGGMGSSRPLNSLNSDSDGDFFDADGSYNDMTAFAKMNAASAGGAAAGSALGSQMSAALGESKAGYMFPSDYVYPSDRDDAAQNAVNADGARKDTSGMSKFQLQMSGQWNQQVLGKETGAGAGAGAAATISLDGQASNSLSSSLSSNEDQTNSDSDKGFSGGREYGGKEYYEPGMSDFEYGDMTDSFSTRRDSSRNDGRSRGWAGGREGDSTSDRQFDSDRDTYGRLGLDSNGLPPVPQEWLSVSSDEESPLVEDIPSDLSAEDQLPLYASVATSPAPVPAPISASAEIGSAALVVEVLRELDKDYMALRSRLVSLIEQQVSPTLIPVPVSSTDVSASHSLQEERVSESFQIIADKVNGLDHGCSDSTIGGMSSNDSTSDESESVTARKVEIDKKITSRFKYWPSRQLVTLD